jgi:hypothetical protein
MTRLFLILTLTAVLGGCLPSGRFGGSQPVQSALPTIDAGAAAPIGEVEAAPLEAPGEPAAPAPTVASAPINPANDPYTWARVDGQRMSGNPLLMKQGQDDRQACYTASASGMNVDLYTRCMRSKGYVQLTN